MKPDLVVCNLIKNSTLEICSMDQNLITKLHFKYLVINLKLVGNKPISHKNATLFYKYSLLFSIGCKRQNCKFKTSS